MKTVIFVALALVALAVTAPTAEEPFKILRFENEQLLNGYNFGFDTENGISRKENGALKEVFDEENKSHQVVVVRGTYTYTDNEGNVETINYEADENGYHAEGPSVPKPTTTN